MKMNIALNPADLERAQRLLRGIKGGAQKAMARALNRTAQTTRTQMVKRVTERYTVKNSSLKPTMRVSRADHSNLEARIDVKSTQLSAKEFKVKPKTDTTGRPNKKVNVELLRGSPFNVGKGFVWRGHVFERTGEPRKSNEKLEQIAKMTGPAVPQMIGSNEVIEQVEKYASEHLSERLRHEITVLLEGWDKK